LRGGACFPFSDQRPGGGDAAARGAGGEADCNHARARPQKGPAGPGALPCAKTMPLCTMCFTMIVHCIACFGFSWENTIVSWLSMMEQMLLSG